MFSYRKLDEIWARCSKHARSNNHSTIYSQRWNRFCFFLRMYCSIFCFYLSNWRSILFALPSHYEVKIYCTVKWLKKNAHTSTFILICSWPCFHWDIQHRAMPQIGFLQKYEGSGYGTKQCQPLWKRSKRGTLNRPQLLGTIGFSVVVRQVALNANNTTGKRNTCTYTNFMKDMYIGGVKYICKIM